MRKFVEGYGHNRDFADGRNYDFVYGDGVEYSTSLGNGHGAGGYPFSDGCGSNYFYSLGTEEKFPYELIQYWR